MPHPDRPLPDSLTRLLAASPPAADAPIPRRTRRVPPPPGERRLEAVVLRGIVHAIAAFVWLAVACQAVRHLSR